MLTVRNRIVVVATAHHRPYVEGCLGSKSTEYVLHQPWPRDTAPGLLLPLVHVLQRDPAAVVAVFPSDHFVQPGRRFMESVGEAVRFVTQATGRHIVLLAVEPTDPEPDYGWVNPGQQIARSGRGSIYRVERFVEKPTVEQARLFLDEGWLWNTMVLVGPARRLLTLILDAAPQLAGYFSMIRQAIATHWEQQVLEEVYRMMPSVNLSTVVFEQSPDRIAVLPVRRVLWSDWGREARILDTLRRLRIPLRSQARTTPANDGAAALSSEGAMRGGSYGREGETRAARG